MVFANEQQFEDGIESSDISMYSDFVGSVVDLNLLKLVDKTCDALDSYARTMETLSKNAFSLISKIDSHDPHPEHYLDSEDSCIERFERAVAFFSSEVSELKQRQATIDRDRHLNRNSRQRLHLSYDHLLTAIEVDIVATKDLIAAIIRHDLKAEPRPTSGYDNAADLISELKKH